MTINYKVYIYKYVGFDKVNDIKHVYTQNFTWICPVHTVGTNKPNQLLA